MDKAQLAEWRKEIVTAMLAGGYCIERIIPDVMIAEKFIATGEYPEQWGKEEDSKNQTSGE